MLNRSRYLQHGEPTTCANCGRPFSVVADRVECWRGENGDYFCARACAESADKIGPGPEDGVLKHRCDHCGGPLGLIVRRYYHMRFCCNAHVEAYRRRLSETTRAKIQHLNQRAADGAPAASIQKQA